MSTNDEIEALKREVAALKSALPTARDDKAESEWRAQVHRMHEARMNLASPPMSREDLAAMTAACPKDAIADIVAHGRVPERSAAGAAGEITMVSPSPGLPGSGTREAIPIGPPPGVSALDRIANVMQPHGPLNPLTRAGQAKEAPTKE
jgi:hypothetical protein